ncbi:MAG: hypothetical protein WBE78_04615, partial [Candidatus Binataceae bacterium]
MEIFNTNLQEEVLMKCEADSRPSPNFETRRRNLSRVSTCNGRLVFYQSIQMGDQSMFSRKPFVKLGTIMTAVAAGLFFASGAFAADSATAGLGPLSAQATGTAVTDSGGCTTPTISCPGGHACLCMTGTYSITGNNGFNGGTASLTLGIDITNLGDPITAVPPCAPATGVGTISDKKGHQTITFLASGPVCSTNNNAVDVFTGS